MAEGCARHPEVAASQACTYCRRSFCHNCLVPIKGQLLCAECKHGALCRTFRHDPYADYTIRVTPVPLGPDGLPQGAACALHMGNAAVQNCARCGDFMCALCDTNFEGHHYCAGCLDILWTRGNLVPPPASANALASLICGGVAMFVFCSAVIAVPAGIAAVVLGIIALNQMARNPQIRGRWMAITGLVLGVLATILSLVITYFAMRG